MNSDEIDSFLDELEEKFGSTTPKTEVIPVVSVDDEDMLLRCDDEIPEELPLLPLRDNVLFPGVMLPIQAGRKSSIRLLKKAEKSNELIAVVTQRTNAESPRRDDLYDIGVVAKTVKVIELPGNQTMGILHGIRKFRLKAFHSGMLQGTPTYSAQIELLPEDCYKGKTAELRAQLRTVRDQYTKVLKSKNAPRDMATSLKNIKSDRVLVNFIAAHGEFELDVKQRLLSVPTYDERMTMLTDILADELNYIQVQNDVQRKAQKEMDRQHREYFLNQQMRAIQDELGGSPSDQLLKNLADKAEYKEWPDEARQCFFDELNKLQYMVPSSPDYTVLLNHLQLMLELPWKYYTADSLDLKRAKAKLDLDHYGIENVKTRILEQLAVMQLRKNMRAPILCLVGPPGTGKTSLGKSIASALNRKYVRMALGGLHDESEIRGHRKTYVGSMPGRIIQGIKKAQSSNPVFVLDEIDKVQTTTVNGDPTAALLEVLDPEQNSAFHDNYLDVDYDLSKVMFIATANSLSTIQPALLDRMEVIELSGYILEEKIEIAQRHLIPRLLQSHGMKRGSLTFDNEVLATIINDYTRESGVRQLEKSLAKIMRCKAVQKANGERVHKAVKIADLQPMLGLPIHQSERRAKTPRVGVVTGLAWTQVGGEILFIEASTSKGKGTLSMTGNLGDVMKESATLAFEYLKANADRFGVDQEKIDNSNIHIHVPEGATPKDGPSAGITMFVAMVSAFTQRKVKPNVAMTGEITLRGDVTPIGGVKEKILAAKRAQITDLILCEDNRRDVEDINSTYLEGLTFHYVNEMSEVLDLVFTD